MTKKITIVALVAIMLLTAVLPASAAIQATSVEVRGSVSEDKSGNDAGDVNDLSVTSWNARNFAGFWYDLKNNKTSENLIITGRTDRSIAKEMLWYNSSKQFVQYKVNEKNGSLMVEYGLLPDGTKASSAQNNLGGYYATVGWMAEKYVGLNGKNNKLAKLILEQEEADKKTLTVGETWDMGDGYTINAQAIDAKATPRQAWLVLSKDGVKLDDKVIGQGQVYSYYEKSLAGESNVPIFVTYVDSVFAGATSDMVQLKYTWVISKSITEVKSGDTYGVFKVDSEEPLRLKSDSSVSLSSDAKVDLIGNMKFRVADNSTTLRFYPMVDYVIGGVPPGVTTPGVTTPGKTPGVNETLVKPPVNATAAAAVPPTAAAAATTKAKGEPGFEAVFAIAGLLAVAFLVLRQRK
jgi:S-layer protein (TIGR01567 family)